MVFSEAALKHLFKEHELPLGKNERLYFIPKENLKAANAKNTHLLKGEVDDEGKLIRLVGRTLCGGEKPKDPKEKNQTVKLPMDEIGARLSSAKLQNKKEMDICGQCVATLYAKQK